MSAQNYDVTFGYGAKDGKYYGTNGSIGLYHKGNDRSTPVGTPIDIGGTTIGLTGKSGAVSGAHLHTQAGTDLACRNTFDPTPIEFKPGIVVATGFGNQWGNYITLQVGDKYITYAHLSQINVKVGQIIGGKNMKPATTQDVDDIIGALWGANKTNTPAQDIANHHKNWDGKPFYDVWRASLDDPRTFAYADKCYKAINNNPLQKEVDARDKKIAALEGDIKNVYEPKIKQLQSQVIDQTTKDQVAETNSIVKQIWSKITEIFK